MCRIFSIMLLILFSSSIMGQEGAYTSVEEAPLLNSNHNQVSSATYDFSGNTLVKSRSFYNSIGRLDQSQTWDIRSEKVWGSQTLYDHHGRPALSTLSAPIGNSFGYRNDFILDANNSSFTSLDFDTNSTIENPSTVGLNSDLRNYYSTQNTSNLYQDVTAYPYNRTVYSDLNPGQQLRMIGGNKMAGEWKQGYTFTMTAGTELSSDKAFGSTFDTSGRLLKTVSRDVHGVEVVSFSDTDGKVLANARSGDDGLPDPHQRYYFNFVQMGEQAYVDIHLPEGIDSFRITNTNSTASGSIRIYNLITEELLSNTITGSTSTVEIGNSGFYRVFMTNPNAFLSSNAEVEIRHSVNYYDYALNSYDDADRLVSSKQPLGHQESTFEYNSLGQLLSTTSPDEGAAKFIYRTDGQIRFSQNSKQAFLGEFSYTNYDDWGRPTDSGVYVGAFPDESQADTWQASCGVTGEAPPTEFLYDNIINYTGNIEVSWQVTSTRFFAGLDHGASSTNWTNTVYGLYCDNGQLLPTLHGTCVSGSIGSYTPSDVLSIVRVGDAILFKKNTTVLYSINTLDSTPLGINGGVYIASSSGDLSNEYSISSTLDENQTIPPATDFGSLCKEQVFTLYDTPDTGLDAILNAASCSFPASDYKQHFVGGNVSKTWTMRPKTNMTWYSYDVLGRVEWVIQKNPGMSCATTLDYTYDPSTSQVALVDFQRHNAAERFVHKYEYTIAGQLERVLTSRDGVAFEEQARYEYNTSGALVRTVIGEDLQGIDYVYNLNGQLKGINHPSLEVDDDPGRDGSNGIARDLFGMAIDYYNGDYTRANTPTPVAQINTNGVDQFNGNIKGVRFKTEPTQRDDSFSTYEYEYNKNNWLKDASYGTGNEVAVSGGKYQVNSIVNANKDYRVADITYDENGNIQTLTRNGFTDATGINAMDNFNYKYVDNGNKLAYVEDRGDNTDPNRYNDLKDQTSPNSVHNYSYNSIGQLTMDLQEGITYSYTTSGLVDRIGGFSATDSGMYETIYEENFNGSTGQAFADQIIFESWGDAQISTPPGCGYYSDYGTMLNVNGQGQVSTRLTTATGAYHTLSFKALYELGAQTTDPYARRGVSVTIHAPDGTQLGSWGMSNYNGDDDDEASYRSASSSTAQTRTTCDVPPMRDAVIEFVAPGDYVTFSIEGSGFDTVDTYLTLDNLQLEVATEDKLRFVYDDRGHRIKKEVYSQEEVYTTHYIRDISGSPMAIYNSSTVASNTPQQGELPIYGASRVGVYKKSATNPQTGIVAYQLQDHLGNVRAVVSKINGNAVSLVSKADYYPFGMQMPNKTQEGDYRYAYQGQEKDPETGKEAFELRLWDGRIGRWLTTDPYRQYASPYVGMGNDPVNGIDPDGGFKTRFGAWVYKTIHGTGGEIFENDHGTWAIDTSDGSYEGGNNLITGTKWEEDRFFGEYNQMSQSFEEKTGYATSIQVHWSSPEPLHNSVVRNAPLVTERQSSEGRIVHLKEPSKIGTEALNLAKDGALGRLIGDKVSSPSGGAATGALAGKYLPIPSLEEVVTRQVTVHTEKHHYGIKIIQNVSKYIYIRDRIKTHIYSSASGKKSVEYGEIKSELKISGWSTD